MQSEQQPTPLWKIPFETKNNIADFRGDVFLCLLSGSTWKLLKTNAIGMFKDSIFCRKNSIILTAEEIRKVLPATKAQLGETNLVIQIPENYASFNTKFITEFGDFAGLLQLADMYDLNFDFIVTHPNFIIWVTILREEIKSTYKNNNILFTSDFDNKIINKLDIIKTVPNGALNKSNYPTKAAQTRYLSISVKSMEANPKEDREYLSMILSTLAKNKSDTVSLFASELISTLLYSIKYYDLVMNLEVYEMAELMCPKFYLYFKYALRLMYLEERGTYIATKQTDRFILSSKVLSVIKPQAQTEQILDHPFIPVCFEGQTPGKSFDLSYYLNYKMRGIHNLEQIKNRLNIFSFGALANWTPVQICSNGQAVTSAINGSIITATCIKNPLEVSFKYIEDYFEKFYPSRKIKTDSQTVEIKKVKTNQTPKQDKLPTNSTLLYHQDDTDSDEDINVVLNNASNTPTSIPKKTSKAAHKYGKVMKGSKKSSMKFPLHKIKYGKTEESDSNSDSSDSESDDKESEKSEETKDEKSEETKEEDPYKGTADIDIMVETIDMNLFDEVAQMHYNNFKQARPNMNITLDRVQTENKYKYSIRGLERAIDIFSVNSIPGVIAKFHLGCVRAWVSDDLYAFPSFVSAAFTGLNIDVRWVSCNKDLRDIIIKYWSRGFGTILSFSNRKCLVEYLASTPYKDLIPKLNASHSWRDRSRLRSQLLSSIGFDKPHVVFGCMVNCKYKKPSQLKYQQNQVYLCKNNVAEWKTPYTF